MLTITPQNNINFKGHCGCEKIKKGAVRMLLTTETAFGREFETLDFAVKHINKKFPNLPEKRFIVGACSSGEEVWTLKMLMGEKPVRILGFDIAPKALDTAQNGTYTFYSPDSNKIRLLRDCDGYKDIFLAYDKPHTVKEKRLYKMFHNMFQIFKIPKSFILKNNKILYKLKNPQTECKFIEGDITNLPPEITEGNKSQLFSFRNALYHLLTFHNGWSRESRDTKLLKPMLDSLIKNVNKTLDVGGLFIMGEHENEQCNNIKLVTKALQKNGFKPLIHNEKFCNIWEKIKEIQ